MTLADLKAEAFDQVDQLRRERDEARRRAADLTKILIREGGVEGAYERQLAQALKERDEARAELAKFKAMNFTALSDCMAQRDEARAEVERLRWLAEAGCENTPTKGCECPGCCTARERAERGEA